MADVEKLRKVKQCIDSLAEGLNPFTGQPLPEEDIVNDVRVSRSLFLASAFLQEQMQGTTAKKTGKKQAFRLSLEEREQVEFSSQPIPASELARRMNEAVGTQDCKKISYRQITDWLVEVGMLKLVENAVGTQRRRPTDSGEKLGISKRIYQYSLDGTFIREWKSISEAGRALHISASNITMCAQNTRKQAGGFCWKYNLPEKEDKL